MAGEEMGIHIEGHRACNEVKYLDAAFKASRRSWHGSSHVKWTAVVRGAVLICLQMG